MKCLLEKQTEKRERIGSVVECFTREQGVQVRASPVSLCCVLDQDALILS